MKRNLLFLIIVMIVCPLSAYAGITGILSGKVVDEKGKAISGASIRILGTTKGGSTKLKGDFLISNITAGNYTVQAKYVGYKLYSTNVRITPDQTTELMIKLVDSNVTSKQVDIIVDRNKGNNEKLFSVISASTT